MAGINKEHIVALHLNKRPSTNQEAFLFDRAKENLIKGVFLQTTNK